jgi:endothelin-converting enzyme
MAYPTDTPDAINATDLVSWYSGLEIGSSHLNNTLNWRRWDAARSWDLLSRPVYEWPAEDHVYLVNAAYMPTQNSIYFPAGILRFPLFTPTLPSYIIYGAFGSVSGHELTHGFDNTGRLFNDVGALSPGQWDNETVAGFTEHTECFVQQYDNFTVYSDYPVAGATVANPATNGTLRIDGKKTLNENLADAGGIATSFAAWSARKDAEPDKNPLLPGLEGLTPEQLFFVAFGQFFCHRREDAALVKQIATDDHAPEFARIRGIMENSKGFREAFQCAKKEPVCELW